MCGITGFLSPQLTPAAPIAAMNALVRHRGPDDEGFLLVRDHASAPVLCGGDDTPSNVRTANLKHAPHGPIRDYLDMPVILALGHRRLSIVDLSPAGHQPMCSPDRRYWIVYNGEIYNHIELRQELENLGYSFRSHSDTEVILAAFAEWGSACLNRFNGMWAFAIYDVKRAELFLARDRFGIKPLYYWVAPCGTFCFASEIKSFTKFPGWRARLNPRTAYDFLAWGLTDHTGEAMFSRVYQLRPGHHMQLSATGFMIDRAGALAATKWYELKGEAFSGGFGDAASAFREKFFDAVRLHLRADVPVGSCLSGGLDSSSIVCAMNQLLKEQGAARMQKSFSACSEEKRFDEREWINVVVGETGVQAHYVYPALEKLFFESPSITWHQDEPFGSTSVYAQWNVFRLAAANDVKVMLDGQGADEALGGYHGFFGARFAALLRAGRWLQLWHEIQQTKRMHGYSEVRAAMYIANILLPESIKQRLRAYAGKSSARPDWLNIRKLGVDPANPLTRGAGDLESIQGMSRAQLTATNLQMLLHWEDRDSMAHSVESRVPFLDYRLVEFALGLPDDYKLANGVTKRVQRKGMSGVLPDRIRDRVDKIGFATAEEVWVRKHAPELFRKKLRHAVEVCDGIILDSSLDMLDDIISSKKPFSYAPWRLINFAEWMEVFSVQS